METSFKTASAVFMGAALIACATTAPAFAGIIVTDAKIASGRLTVTGTNSKANTAVTLDGKYTAMSSATKAFTFNLVYHPEDCVVELTEAGLVTPVRAVVADCGPRGLNAKGAWSPTLTYAIDDLVTSLGSSWRAKIANINKPPSSYPGVWEKLAAKGDAGPAGPKGASGPAGATGADGPTGPEGPQGSTGPTGAQGPAGAPGVVSIYSLNGNGGPISLPPQSGRVFFGPVVTVTLSPQQRLTASASMAVQAAAASPSITGTQYGANLCVRPSGSTQLHPLADNDNWEIFGQAKLNQSTPVTVSATRYFPTGGTLDVGFCMRNLDFDVALSTNSLVMGWLMVTN